MTVRDVVKLVIGLVVFLGELRLGFLTEHHRVWQAIWGSQVALLGLFLMPPRAPTARPRTRRRLSISPNDRRNGREGR